MAPRANWKGYLRLSLVSCPIALYPASSLSEKVSFNRINRKTDNRLKQQNVDTETGEVVARDDTVRGYEVAKGQYMVVEDEEIEAVQIESTRTIDIDQFVPKDGSEAAIECLRNALRAAPDYADAMFNLALLLQRNSKHAEAAEYWRRYLANDTQSEWAARASRSLKFCEMQLRLSATSVQR